MQSLFQASPPGGEGWLPVCGLPKKFVAEAPPVSPHWAPSLLRRRLSRYQEGEFGEQSRRAKTRDDALRRRAQLVIRLACAQLPFLPRSSMVSLPGGLALREAHLPRNLLTKTKKLAPNEPVYGFMCQVSVFMDHLIGLTSAFSSRMRGS